MRTPTPVTTVPASRGRPGSPAPGAAARPPSRDFGRLFVGLVVVTLGVLFLLDSAGVLSAGRAIDRWWPAAIVAAGALTLAERPRAAVRGAVLVGAGVLLLLFTTGVLKGNAWNYAWPLAVIAVGLVIVMRWRGRSPAQGASTDEALSGTAVFGGSDLVSASPRLRGGSLTAIFGGITVDLRGARPAPEGASINATAVFGGIDVLVPRGWRITLRSMPVFGGLDDKTDHTVDVPPDAPTLHIDAVSIFGGVSLKHDK